MMKIDDDDDDDTHHLFVSYALTTGIVFIVTGRAKFTQAQGTINNTLFQAFQCQPDGGRFTIDLPLLLECLQVSKE